MKKLLRSQNGFTLVEVVVSMILMMIVFACLASLFAQSVLIWTIEKNEISIEQTARIAVDTMVREIRYAQDMSLTNTGSLTITKPSGETKTFQLGGGLHANTLYMIINKQGAIPAGGTATNPITENIVTTLLFTPYPELTNVQAMLITLEVIDQKNNQRYTIHTAGYPWNSNKILLY